MHTFVDRNVLITGAASGIGAACVEAFRAHGASVVGCDISNQHGIAPCDITSEVAVETVFDHEGPFTDVVNCAGIVEIDNMVDTSLEAFRRVVEVNLIGTFIVAKAAATRLPNGGSITLLSSQGGRTGGGGWSAYCASKFGVIGLGESLAQELASRSIRVNMVCPGTVDTPMLGGVISRLARQRETTVGAVRAGYVGAIPMGRFASPADVANACVMLASPLATFITGASLVVDGGELS